MKMSHVSFVTLLIFSCTSHFHCFAGDLNAIDNVPTITVRVKGVVTHSVHFRFYLQHFEQTHFYATDTIIYCKDNIAIAKSPYANHPSHFTLALGLDSVNRPPGLFDLLLLPGDAIDILYDTDGQFHFSGKGSEKCRAQYAMQVSASYTNLLGHPASKSKYNMARFYANAFDSIGQIKLKELKKFEPALSKEIYNTLACDAQVSCYHQQLQNTFYHFEDVRTPAEFAVLSRWYIDSLSHIGDKFIDNPAILQSKDAPHLYVLKEQLAVLLLHGAAGQYITRKYPGFEIVNGIKDKYSGALRDNILTQFLITRTNDYDSMALFSRQSLPYILDPVHKNLILQLQKKCKGSPIYNYSLTNDAGQTIGPTDFLGKVVVMDFWFNGCVACKASTTDMKKLMDGFGKDSSVVVLSVNIDRNRETWFRHIDDYVIPGAVKVTTGALRDQHPLLEYYDIYGYPTLIVVDKKGKIVSFDPDHYSTKALFDTVRRLVEQALKEG